MFDFGKIKSPIILAGDECSAYRDPAVYYENGKFYLFCTYVDCSEGAPYLTTVLSISENLTDWSKPRELTARDRSLNFSSPGNVIKTEKGYFLCLQTYCRENGEKYGNDHCRVWTMRSDDLENWEEPRLLRVKGGVPVENMGRMIDPFLVHDLKDDKKWWCLYKQNGVSMSYSYDLENWTYHGKTPCGENVCALRDGDSYLIFHSPPNGIGVLRSENLTDFRAEGELITLGQTSWDWARGRITAGFVLDLKDNPDYGKYIMFFHGSGPEDEETMFDFNASIGIAWSDDLKIWSYPSEET